MQNCPKRHGKVLVVGGGELQTGSHISDINYSIQTHQFHNDFKIIPLKGYDIVLGGDWLAQHSPAKFDYHTRNLKIRQEGRTKLVLTDASLVKDLQLISIK